MRSMPDEEFAMMFATEYYIEPGLSRAMEPGWPFRAPD
jgi:hypothetical protein